MPSQHHHSTTTSRPPRRARRRRPPTHPAAHAPVRTSAWARRRDDAADRGVDVRAGWWPGTDDLVLVVTTPRLGRRHPPIDVRGFRASTDDDAISIPALADLHVTIEADAITVRRGEVLWGRCPRVAWSSSRSCFVIVTGVGRRPGVTQPGAAAIEALHQGEARIAEAALPPTTHP